jgi:hypothetical protein
LAIKSNKPELTIIGDSITNKTKADIKSANGLNMLRYKFNTNS